MYFNVVVNGLTRSLKVVGFCGVGGFPLLFFIKQIANGTFFDMLD